MKIALVSPYDFAYPGGVVNHISSLEHQFTKMGHEVKVIAPASKFVPDFGDRFIPIGKPRPIPVSGSIARITISPRLSATVKAVLAREHFDIIHLHEPLVPTLCPGVLRFSRVPNVGTFHASGAREWYNMGSPLGKFFLNKWCNKLDCKIAVSEPARDYVNKYFPANYNLIPNGIDLDRFNPEVSPIEEFRDGKRNILFVGRLEYRKGLNYLLMAYRRVKREVPDSRLIVVGPGTRLRRRYEKWVKKVGLQDVVFVGYVGYDDLPRYYQTADVFCAPSTGWESFGIILLEAMAVGKPVIASNIDGYASVITHNSDGILVTPKDEYKLSRALVALLNDEALCRQMAANGKLKAQQYGWELIARRVLDCYFKVLSESPGIVKLPNPKDS